MLSLSSEDIDSGMESLTQESKESSPKRSDLLAVEDEPDEDEDIDETLGERLWGLTEMFPDTVRSGTWLLTSGCISGVQNLYSFSRVAAWVIFSSATILMAPVLLEVERTGMEEMHKQQQRQILLGPNAAVSGGGKNPMGMLVPGPTPLPPQ